MSPALTSSQSFIFAAAMAVSGTVIFLSFAFPKPFPATPSPENQPLPLRSCLSSDERRKSKKKRVTFSDEVEVVEVARSRPSIKKSGVCRGSKTTTERPCRNEIVAVDRTIPANHVALYHGILRDRAHAHRMECSY